MVERDDSVPTSSSYGRMVAREAMLMPQVLDGLGPLTSRKPMSNIYEHILKCDKDMRQLFRGMPAYLLRDTTPDNLHKLSQPVWLPTARRTLAISAADKIITTHRPVLFYSFQDPAFSTTRTTCCAAAVTILREHERAVMDGTLSIWTQTAFCITAVMVLGTELLHRQADEQAAIYRQLLSKVGERLRSRRCDVLARSCAELVGVFLKLEEELVVKAMRMHEGTLEEKRRKAISEITLDDSILAKFRELNVGLEVQDWPWASPTAMPTFDPSFQADSVFEDFGAWFDEVFGSTDSTFMYD